MTEQATTTLFMHIPKTAGSTMRDVLSKNFSTDRTFLVYTENAYSEQREKFYAMDHSEPRLIAGHFQYGLHSKISEFPCHYVTLLRNPIERVVSYYYHLHRDEKHCYHTTVVTREMSLRDFVGGLLPAELDNGQTRFLAGQMDLPIGHVNPETLELAKQNLTRTTTTFGITEYFDSSLTVFQRKFGWSDIEYERKNVGFNRPTENPCDDEVRELITQTNLYDLELYQWAKERFENNVRNSESTATAANLRLGPN